MPELQVAEEITRSLPPVVDWGYAPAFVSTGYLATGALTLPCATIPWGMTGTMVTIPPTINANLPYVYLTSAANTCTIPPLNNLNPTYVTPTYPALTHEEYQRNTRRQGRRREIERLRAERLLRLHLDEDQSRELDEHGYFHVTTQGGAQYQIRRGRSRNVRRMDGEERLYYCLHPYDIVPNEDTMLAQKILLECDEQEFLRQANPSYYP